MQKAFTTCRIHVTQDTKLLEFCAGSDKYYCIIIVHGDSWHYLCGKWLTTANGPNIPFSRFCYCRDHLKCPRFYNRFVTMDMRDLIADMRPHRRQGFIWESIKHDPYFTAEYQIITGLLKSLEASELVNEAGLIAGRARFMLIPAYSVWCFRQFMLLCGGRMTDVGNMIIAWYVPMIVG